MNPLGARRVKSISIQPSEKVGLRDYDNKISASKEIVLKLSEGPCRKIEIERICKKHGVDFASFTNLLTLGESVDGRWLFLIEKGEESIKQLEKMEEKKQGGKHE